MDTGFYVLRSPTNIGEWHGYAAESKANRPLHVRSFFFGLGIRFNPLEPGAEPAKPESSNKRDVFSPHEIGSTVPMAHGRWVLWRFATDARIWDWSTGREADSPCQGDSGALQPVADLERYRLRSAQREQRVTKSYVKHHQLSGQCACCYN
jgi:hypothetical protein